MTRAELVAQIRLSSLVEDTNVTDVEIQDIINNGLHWVDGYYPYPVTIIELATDGSSPAFAEEFHWILVDWGISKLMEREEYYDVAMEHFKKAQFGAKEMIRFYTGGRT